MNPMGGIGQQVGADLMELGKSVAKGVVKATGDVMTDTIETTLSAPVGAVKPDQGKQLEQGKGDDKNQQAMIKKQKEKRQFQEVRNQLAEYIQRKKQQDAQIAQEKQQEEQKQVQKKQVEKQEKEGFLQQLMKNLARSSHGETDRQKE